MKNDMKKTNYYKSGEHTKNMLLAQQKSLIVCAEKRTQRIELYYKNPKLCINCNNPIKYEVSNINKFCTKSCSAKFNNKLRITTEETKQKRSIALTGKKYPFKEKPRPFCRISWHNCQVCNTPFYSKGWRNQRRKTCSDSCRTHLCVGIRSYPNGGKKLYKYFNIHEKLEITLESTWELDLAKWLDEHNIIWNRPSFIEWIDHSKNEPVTRNYYPDFYLPQFDLYLDPKNPYAMTIGKYKMEQVSKLVHIVYGDLTHIKNYITLL